MHARLVLSAALAVLVTGVFDAAPRAQSPPQRPTTPAREAQPLKLPEGWPAGDPLPYEKTNCVRCHLTAGRELTTPVHDFARSAHDWARLSCNNCHGGDTAHDATAHEAEHGFIGTKLSAHIAACSRCHADQSQLFRKGKHYWDLAKSINRKYPVCIDCHGNHDIGKPPSDFTLMNVCTDCHKQFARDLPDAAAVVAENDRLWQTLRRVETKNKNAAGPVPERFQREVDGVRASTSRLIHRAGPISADESRKVNERAEKLRRGLEEWLKQQTAGK